jgi:hypothetical protein
MTGGEGGGAALGRQNQELQNSGIFVFRIKKIFSTGIN